ncbi:MAG TPA: hypothetical protein VK493_01035 [Bryobacteraceae bacterium]|nr:hypothetical protein [Bryobacteraceae bacterium]
MRNEVAFLPLAGLLFCLFFDMGCGKAPLAGVSVDPAFRPFVLPGTKALVSVQLDKVKTTEIYQRHQQEFNLPQLNTLAERTGLDPRRDLASFLVSWDGSHPLLLARGSFTAGNLEKQLRDAGAVRTSYKAYTLLGNPRESVAFPQAGFAVAGAAVPLRAALDSHAAGNGGVPEELQQRLAGVPKSAQIWEASSGGLPFAEMAMRSDLASALSNISGYVSGTSAGITLASGANVQADIICVSNEGAQRVHDALRGVIGLSRLSTNESRLDMLRLWDAIHVDQDQQAIHIRVDLPADLADKLLAELPRLASRAGGMIK